MLLGSGYKLKVHVFQGHFNLMIKFIMKNKTKEAFVKHFQAMGYSLLV